MYYYLLTVSKYALWYIRFAYTYIYIKPETTIYTKDKTIRYWCIEEIFQLKKNPKIVFLFLSPLRTIF